MHGSYQRQATVDKQPANLCLVLSTRLGNKADSETRALPRRPANSLPTSYQVLGHAARVLVPAGRALAKGNDRGQPVTYNHRITEV